MSRDNAESTKGSVNIDFGGQSFRMLPHAFGKYAYCLDHPFGRVGVTPSRALPAIRVQPRAEFLHAVGPEATVEWFRNVIESACGATRLSVSRVDLFADVQGWAVGAEDRHRFVRRPRNTTTHEEDEALTGLTFGSRARGGLYARIYDKTIEMGQSNAAYMPLVWGERYVPGERVMRVEFQVGREVVRQFGLSHPDDVLAAVGPMWMYLTCEWLSLREPSGDQTRSRWPVSPEWESITHARISSGAVGISRAYDAKRAASVSALMPLLVGCLASFGALTECESWPDVSRKLDKEIGIYELLTGKSLVRRIADRRLEMGFP